MGMLVCWLISGWTDVWPCGRGRAGESFSVVGQVGDWRIGSEVYGLAGERLDL